VGKLAALFMQHEEALLNGTLQKDLLSCLPDEYTALIKDINTYSYNHVYNYKSVVEIEIAGYNLIGGLLQEFVHAVLHPSHSKSGKVIQLVSKQFPITQQRANVYADVQSVVDFIAGMTDLYAIDLYRKMTGISIPQLR
jgi:dGTPase